MSNKSSFIRSALHFLSGTALSRITGMIREVSMAFFFGACPAIAAFLVAFRFSNLIRRIFGESALLSGFIPHFESHRIEDNKKAAIFFRDTFFSISISLLILISIAEIILFPFWKKASIENKDILFLTMIMLPGVLFICLYGLFSAYMQCEKKFFLSGFAPVGFNIVWIAAVFMFRNATPSIAAIGLSVGIIFAFFMQWFLLVPKTYKYLFKYLSLKEWLTIKLFPKSIRKMINSVLLGSIGVGAMQINSALDALFSRYASLEGPAFLSYAIRLEQLPFALIAIAISSALLPPLSNAIQLNQKEKFQSLLGFSVSQIITILLPCTFAIWMIGFSGTNLIYNHGAFDNVASLQTSYCLWAYALGLVPAAFSIIFSSAFYAYKDYKTPTKASIYSVIFNVIMNYCFIVILKKPTASVAIATSLASFFNAAYLYIALKKKTQTNVFLPIMTSFLKVLFCSFLAVLITNIFSNYFLQEPNLLNYQIFQQNITRSFNKQLINFFSLFICFFGVFLISAKLMKIDDIKYLLNLKKQPLED